MGYVQALLLLRRRGTDGRTRARDEGAWSARGGCPGSGVPCPCDLNVVEFIDIRYEATEAVAVAHTLTHWRISHRGSGP